MRSLKKPRTLFFLVLMALCVWGAIALQRGQLRRIEAYRPFYQSLLAPRTEYANLMAFGYDSMLADLLYIRTIQAFGGRGRGYGDELDALFQHFYTASKLDPQFVDMYEFGSMVIGEDGGRMDLANKLLTQGWLNNPNHYRIPYLAAYMNWWGKKNEILAELWTRRAMRAPDAPEFVSRILAYIKRESGRFEAAMQRWIWEYLEALRTDTDYRIALAERQILLTTGNWNLQFLHDALNKYREEHNGALPESLGYLAEQGYLSPDPANSERRVCNLPVLWTRLQQLAQTEFVPDPDSPEGAAIIQDIMDAAIVPPHGVPISPNVVQGEQDFYFLRRDVLPELVDQVIEEKNFVMNREAAREFIQQRALPFLAGRVRNFREENLRVPFSLMEPFDKGIIPVGDPLAIVFDYDPATGEISSRSFPDLKVRP